MNKYYNIIKQKTNIPFNPQMILKEFSISIKTLDFNSKQIAIIEKENEQITIFIRSDIQGFKRKFLLSQQIARLTLGQLDKVNKIETLDLNLSKTNRIIDKVANDETMELLTPRKEIQKYRDSFDIEELCSFFDVEEPLMYERLKNLKLI